IEPPRRQDAKKQKDDFFLLFATWCLGVLAVQLRTALSAAPPARARPRERSFAVRPAGGMNGGVRRAREQASWGPDHDGWIVERARSAPRRRAGSARPQARALLPGAGGLRRRLRRRRRAGPLSRA